MSREIVDGPGGLYVIDGDPTIGYYIRPVVAPIAHRRQKFVARQAIRSGEIRPPACESCSQPAAVPLDDGSWWCSACDSSARRLGYDEERP